MGALPINISLHSIN